jgi:hypothetical protein
MRNLYLVGLLTFFSWHTMSQTLQKSLETGGTTPITTSATYNPGYSVYSNYENRLHNVEAPFMNSLLEMYETTKNPEFLDCFMIHAYNVIERRDDILALDPSIPVTGLGSIPKPASGKMAWSSRLAGSSAWEIDLLVQGTISFPLAKFAYMVKVKYPGLQSRPAPSTIAGADATGSYYLNNFADCAEFLKVKVNQTARDYLNDFWMSSSYYQYDADANPTDLVHNWQPIIPNYMASIGRVHVYMYKIFEAENNTAQKDYYLDKVQKLASRFQFYGYYYFLQNTTTHTVAWRYMSYNSPMEDIAHGLLMMEFADLCNLFNLQKSTGGAIFDDSLMYDFANTFKTKFMQSPLKFSMSITGWDPDQTQLITSSGAQYTEGSIERYNQYMNAGRFAFLARHIPDIYNMIADYFYDFSLYGPAGYNMYTLATAEQCQAIDAVAQLAHGRTGYVPIFQNYLDIRSVKRTPTYQTGSDLTTGTVWNAVAAGKFDATKTADLFVAAKSTGVIELREFDPTTKRISNSLATYTPGFTADWGGITAGDFIAGNSQSEFVMFNKTDKKLYLFRYSGTAIVLVASFTTTVNWAGIASGNLDASSTDEIVMLSKDNGQVYVYRINFLPLGGGTYSLSGVSITNSSTSTYIVSEASKIAVGNLDKNLTNGLEIVTLNNNAGSDYNIKVLNYTFSGSNMTFSSAISYTGTTGNYSQWDGMTTGDFNADGYDEIMLHRDYDGDFHIQYLDGGIIKSLCKENFPTNWDLGIICSTSFPGSTTKHLISLRNNDGHMFVFVPLDLPRIPSRPANPEDPHGMMTHPSDVEEVRMNELVVSPNPTDGIIQVILPEENTSEMTVISSLGQVVMKVRMTDSNRNQKIDLSDYPSGIYLLKVETNEGIVTKKIWKE